MTQYIPKSTVVAEIEKLISNGKIKCQQSIENNDHISYTAWSEHIATCGKILSLLNTLEVKEVDLRKEMDKEWNKCEPIDEGMGLEIASIEHEQFDNIAMHFFELGLKAQSSYVSIPNIDDTLKEMDVDPDSKLAKSFKESYFKALDELQTNFTENNKRKREGE